MAIPKPRTDAEILVALRTSTSCNRAAESLGLTITTLETKCWRSEVLREAYVALRASVQRCGLCRKVGYYSAQCPKRTPRQKGCRQCEGLPWRRPRGIRKLCACGESYAPEPPLTIAQQFERPNHNRRELI